jgi:hypothetical protein
MSKREFLQAISDQIDGVEDLLIDLDLDGLVERLRELELEICSVCKLRLRSCDINSDLDACEACVEELGVASCRHCRREHLADRAEDHYADYCTELCIECHERAPVDKREFYLCLPCLQREQAARVVSAAQTKALKKFWRLP